MGKRNKGPLLMDIAYLRDGSTTHTGEALLIACLMHAKGQSRTGKDMTDVQKIMHDINLKED